MKRFLTFIGCCVALIGCAPSLAPRQHALTEEGFANQILEKQLLNIGASYADWKRVSDQANWAPERCDIPPPDGPQASDSNDENTHGKKLYYLFARHPHDYMYIQGDRATTSGNSPLQKQPDGQVLVKQSWTPREVSEVVGSQDERAARTERRCLRYAKRDGKYWGIDQQRELFVMLKTDLPIPTDNGWVYALLSPEGQKVIRSGLIEDCMKCHMDAPFDRLFGLPHSRQRHAREHPKLETK